MDPGTLIFFHPTATILVQALISFVETSGPQSESAASESSGNFLEIRILRPHPKIYLIWNSDSEASDPW